MGWNLNIPKILHLYWGGQKMNYLRFMTIKSFMYHNPDWEIRLMIPVSQSNKITWFTYENKKSQVLLCKDFQSEIDNLPITKVDIDLTKYGLKNEMSEVHKSDFIRLIQLSEVGGLWSDMDIIYIKPMTEFYLNTPDNSNIETFICNNEYGHSIGFMMASQGNKFFKKLSELAISHYEPHWYQTLGARLYNRYFSTMESVNELTPAINIDMSVVYPHVAGLEHELLDGTLPRFTDKTLGVHWYAGHPQWQNFLLKTNGGLENLPDCIIGNILKSQE